MSTRFLTTVAFACMICGAGSLVAAVVDGPVGRDAEKGEPARWSQPADTPQKQYEAAMKEANAALAEALRECRETRKADPDLRRMCETEARSRYEDDFERARGILVPHNWG